MVPYVVGAIALVTILAAVVVDQRSKDPAVDVEPTLPQTASAPGTPPDISQMSPRERFDRLFNRIMTATEAGDTAEVTRFSPMALGAYSMLDTIDPDARYHAAMIRLATNDAAGAAALADTILAANPDHLLGLTLRGRVARETGRSEILAASQRGLLAAWDREQAAGRQEYRDHQVILDRFREEARKASGGKTP